MKAPIPARQREEQRYAAAIDHYRAAASRTSSIPERNYLTTHAARLAAEQK